MSLLIKALKKAEKSKEAKAEAGSSRSGLTLELAPIEEKSGANTSPPPIETAQSEAEAKPGAAAEAQNTPLLADLSKPEEPKTVQAAASSNMAQDDIAAALMEESGFSLTEEAGFSEPVPTKTAKAAPSAKMEKASKAVKPPAREPAPEPTVTAAAATSATSSADQRQVAMNLLGTRTEIKRPPGHRRSLILGLAGLLLLLTLGGGFYYYLQTLDQTQLVVMQPPAKTPDAMPTPAPVANSRPTPVPVVAEVKPSPPVEPVPIAALGQPAIQEQESMAPGSSTEFSTARPAASKPMRRANSAPAKKSMSAHHNVATGQDSAMKVARLHMGEPTTDATLVAAYQAYQAGDDTTAGRFYRQVLQADPRNVDALLGLAAVNARQNRNDEAVNNYQRILELDPGNSIAQEGLISLLGQANPTESASRLKTLISQQPDAAHLHAALGNVYADQNQWPDAQQAYFKAYELDPNSADYAFNLAVSLDQLKKPALALNYYQQALALLGKQGGSVDRTALENRISELKAATGN
jgi:tetratricopeptide (TPR) repeat protein